MSFRPYLCAAALVGAASPYAGAYGALTHLITDFSEFDGLAATANGMILANEYSNSVSPLGFGSGAGGLLSAPVNSHADLPILFNLNQASGTVTVGLRANGGTVRTSIILLLNTKPGGRTAGSGPGLVAFNDPTDPTTQALSRLQGALPSGTSTLPGVGQFAADFAITANSSGFGLFKLPDESHSTFTQIGTYTGSFNSLTGIGEVQFPAALFEFPTSVLSLEFTVVIADALGLYNESIPAQPFNNSPNPGATPTDIPHFAAVHPYIPAPSSAAALALSFLAIGRRRRTP